MMLDHFDVKMPTAEPGRHRRPAHLTVIPQERSVSPGFTADPAGMPQSSPPTRTDLLPVLAPGLRVGPYEIVERVGAGGMGEVYRARDPRLGRDVAIKVLRADLARDPERRERFVREARAVSALNHPNICTIHEIGADGDLDYICFEFIEGQTLGHLLQDQGLSIERVLEIASPISEALAYAHGKGILHRDLKPANIIVSATGPKILDFGVAKVLSTGKAAAETPTSLTHAGLVLGTVAYMSPEQVLGHELDERSDIFSLGAVLYEMATGKQAFAGATPTEIMNAVLHHEPVALAQLRPDVPSGLALIVARAIRKDASERYQQMSDLAADLRQVRGHGPRGARLTADPGRRVPAALVALLLSMVAGLALLAWWRTTPSPNARNTVAVMFFENLSDRTDADNLGRMLAGLLTTELSRSEGLQVVSSQRLYDIGRQLGKVDGDPDRAMATDVARRAGVATMILGQVVRAGPRLVATAELVDVSTGRLLESYRTEGTSFQDVFAMAERLGAHVRGKVTGQPSDATGGVSLAQQLTGSADAYRAYVRGEALLHRAELEKAAEAFREAVKLDPQFALAHYRLSIAAGWRASTAETRAAAGRAAALKDRLPPAYREVVEGNRLYVTGRLSEALPILESALARDPENKEILYLLSECYTHSTRDADPRRGAELMRRVLALDPEFHLVYHHLAWDYIYLGEFARAFQKLDEWETKEPDMVRVMRAEVNAYQGRLDDALRLTESASGTDALLARAVHALAAGRWDITQAIVRQHGSDPDLGVSLKWVQAHLHVYLGEFDRAQVGYGALVPRHLEADDGVPGGRTIRMLHGLAELLALKGDMNGARREAERALVVQPAGPFCLYVAGSFASRNGDIRGAERHLRTLAGLVKVARSPLVVHYRDALEAEIALARGRPSEAVRLLEPGVASGKLLWDALFSPGPWFRDGLARAYLASGQKEKAALALEALVANGMQRVRHPVPYVRALYTLGTLRLDLGDEAKGRELLEKFLTHWGKADWDLREVRDARARLASSARADVGSYWVAR